MKKTKSPKALKNEVICLMGGDIERSKSAVAIVLEVLSKQELRSQELWEQVLLILKEDDAKVFYQFCVEAYFDAESDEERAAWSLLAKKADAIENKFIE